MVIKIIIICLTWHFFNSKLLNPDKEYVFKDAENCSIVCHFGLLKYEAFLFRANLENDFFKLENDPINKTFCINSKNLTVKKLLKIDFEQNELIFSPLETECMIKISFQITIINDNLHELTRPELYKETAIQNFSKVLNISENTTYLLNILAESVFIQTKKFCLCTYVIGYKFKTNSSNQLVNYDYLYDSDDDDDDEKNENPILTLTIIRDTNIFLNIYGVSIENKLSYLINLNGSNQSEIRKIDKFVYKSEPPNLSYIRYILTNLQENTSYNLRILDHKSDFITVSNLVSFRTRKKPHIKAENVNSSTIKLKINADCSTKVYDYDYNVYYTQFRITCMSFKIEIKQKDEKNFSETLETYKVKANLIKSDSKFYNDEFFLNNLNHSIDYIVRINVKYPDENVSSNEIHIKTFEDVLVKKLDHFWKIGILSAFLLAIIFCVLMVKLNVKFKKVYNKKIFKSSKNEMDINVLYDWDHFRNKKSFINKLDSLAKINEKSIVIMRKIGSGTFGEVFDGKLKSNKLTKTVAVKKLKTEINKSEQLDLLKEAIALNSFNHENIINFHGICCPKECLNKLEIKYIIMEFMNSGDLLSYLRSIRDQKESLELKRAFKMCLDIALGCCYLESLKFIHRDLAARNCLIHKENDILTVKLADFGLAREIYSSNNKKDYYKQINDVHKLLPIRWMSPESLCDGIYTNKSDVWSFGIVIWEIMTLGYIPYTGLNNLECIEYILNGGTIKIPPYCLREIQAMMNDCWKKSSKERPSFKNIVQQLKMLENNIGNLLGEIPKDEIDAV
ncbi:unnamed protein product [Brachionus calyciflorus]|uniref:Protein kinase domain-containing protein n=1 Tax=Brachionus calyciflorus TaxID=104777 RepID=A0A814EXS0_9BILA|nr:unnamed protein product [Brachionus calyciflorus]